ncbi:type VII secretion integral membrane protein EccD [Mycobacterium shigaense]|uniref:ESX-1 secretion system protein EccD1 n=1 Tax=Mycobacterium shigaense TaxID=722731 RepID=A0A1Z4EQ53_9MYCO|nr:type VII secretion integral membrane protein EccD [Mycobacterium shigaense]PRI15181.1 type VII secretion integral membrane protein EccD [Mycobacterium shigaense]BAX95052.1 ESX-1 secretion system protein EccD1 [Mycobacterium shigaense]
MSAPTATDAAAGAGAAAPASPAKPASTRVTILTGRRMTDVVLPSAAAIETYIDDTVAVLADLIGETTADVLAGFDFAAQGAWTFARPGAPPLPADQSLDDAVVVDGSLLTLVPVSRTERYRPLVEDVIDAIAVLDESPEFDRAALNRFVGVAIPAMTLAITVIAAFTWASTGRYIWWPLALGIAGALFLVGSWAADRFYRNASFGESLLASAFPLIVVAVGLAIPRPRGVASLGPPQYAGAAAAVLFLTLLTRGGPRRRVEIAAFTAVAGTAVTAAAVAWGYGWQHWIPAGAIVFGLFTVTNAAKLTVVVARIALPPIPAPGETVDHDELLDAVEADDAGADKETRTWQAIMASVPASALRLTERSHLAKQLLIGFVTAGTLFLAVGVLAVLVRGHFFVHTLVVAGLATLMCSFRARLYAEPWCAWSLLAAAVAIPVGVTARLCIWYPHSAWLFLTILCVASLVTLAVVGAARGVRRITPVMKRTLELFDGAVIAAILPLLLWITGIYDTVRNIQF